MAVSYTHLDVYKRQVRNSAGEMAPISQFITVDKVYGPDIISRFMSCAFTAVAFIVPLLAE